MRQIEDKAVEPEVNAGDGRDLELTQVAEAIEAFDDVGGEQIEQSIEGHRGDVPIGVQDAAIAQLQACDASVGDG
jgi:hypothetical protein